MSNINIDKRITYVSLSKEKSTHIVYKRWYKRQQEQNKHPKTFLNFSTLSGSGAINLFSIFFIDVGGDDGVFPFCYIIICHVIYDVIFIEKGLHLVVLTYSYFFYFPKSYRMAAVD